MIDDLRHLPHSRRRWHDGPVFLVACCAASAAGYLAIVAVMSLS